MPCGTCAYWQVIELRDHSNRGMCRRLPPSLVPSKDGKPLSAAWPVTQRLDWCGEDRGTGEVVLRGQAKP